MPQPGSYPNQQDWRSAAGAPIAGEATDPWLRPALYRGVLTRRVLAFCVDFFVISIPVVLACIAIFLFGIVTLSLGWALFFLVSPGAALWAVVYYGASLGGPHAATWGMRMMGLRMRTLSGSPGYFLLGAAHAVLFWLSVSFLTPFVLLVPLLNRRRQALHDFVLGTVVVND